jgi:hypothetical protein
VIQAVLLGLILSGGAMAAPGEAASRDESYCAAGAHAQPAKVPADLAARVGRALNLDDHAVRQATFVRCDGDRLLACYVGANLNCFKANLRRTLPGATAWCRDHPGSASIPMYATGHETVYEWSCNGSRAVAGKIAMPVDARGYVAGNWKQVP